MIPLPISDENRAVRTPWVTYALILINVVAWFFELSHGVLESTFDYGAIPSFVLHGMRDGVLHLPELATGAIRLHQEVPWPWTVLTSMFMHGSWLHIIGNMWFLWIFGDNVEDAMGPVKYFIFYFLCGLVAAMSQVLSSPASQVPMVGASGAIAGVLGAYLMLYPHARVRCLWILFILITFVYVPAWLLLGLWFVSQFFMPGEGVAWMAHVGGFATGFLLVRLFVMRPPPRRRDSFPPLFQRVAR
ncbi:MAG TPA: rhomboid family intramembrane serine protease [Polyangia bacterium]